MGAFIPIKSLKGLEKYEYSAVDRSYVSKYVLKPFYTKIVEYLPLWLAPNLVTLMGLGFTLMSALRVFYFAPTFRGTCPWWSYLLAGIEILLYQTFDALDGQQARRTKSSSPLGELFDHCVDAINVSIGVIVFAGTSQMAPWTALLGQFMCTLNFYVSTWEEYHTGTLYLSSFSGPVEGVLMVAFLHMLTAFTGPEIYSKSLMFGLSFNDVYVPFFSLALMSNTWQAAVNVRKAQNGLTKTMHMEGLIPFFVMWTGLFVWFVNMPYLLYDHPIAVIALSGLIFAVLVGRVISAHITNTDFPMNTPLSFLPWVCLGYHYFSKALGWETLNSDYHVFFLALGVCFGVYVSFVTEIVSEITEYLGIKCFTITSKKD